MIELYKILCEIDVQNKKTGTASVSASLICPSSLVQKVFWIS